MINRPSGRFFHLSRRIPSALGSEFGRVIENLMNVAGAMGGVLVDDDGYAIDYVYDPKVFQSLDVQLMGAQVGQTILRTLGSASKMDVGLPLVVLEGDSHTMLAGPVGEHYVLAFMADCNTNIPEAIDHFEAVRRTVEHMLD